MIENKEKEEIKCPRCGSDLIRLNGFILLSGGKTKQRYQCRECGFNFTLLTAGNK